MPFLTVYTNATKINQKNFVEEISDTLSKLSSVNAFRRKRTC